MTYGRCGLPGRRGAGSPPNAGGPELPDALPLSPGAVNRPGQPINHIMRMLIYSNTPVAFDAVAA